MAENDDEIARLKAKLQKELSKPKRKQDPEEIKRLTNRIKKLESKFSSGQKEEKPPVPVTNPAEPVRVEVIPANPKTGLSTEDDIRRAFFSGQGEIILRGGTYTGKYTIRTSDAIFRAAAGERVTFDDLTDKGPATIIFTGQKNDLIGVEVTNSLKGRQYRPGSEENILGDGPQGVRFNGPNNRLIDCIIHDTYASGVLLYEFGNDCHVIGCIFYFIGVSKYDHGIYTHNISNNKMITDDLFVHNFGTGITLHEAHGPGPLSGYTIERIALFDCGLLEEDWRNGNIGTGANIIERVKMNQIFTFQHHSDGVDFQFKYRSPSNTVSCENSIFWGGTLEMNDETAIKTSNVNLWGKSRAFRKQTNDFKGKLPASHGWESMKTMAQPTQMQSFVFPSPVTSGRANIVILNPQKIPGVPVDVSNVLKVGQRYSIRKAENFWNPLISGVWGGGLVSIPMNNTAMDKPVDPPIVPLQSTFPEAGALVLIGE